MLRRTLHNRMCGAHFKRNVRRLLLMIAATAIFLHAHFRSLNWILYARVLRCPVARVGAAAAAVSRREYVADRAAHAGGGHTLKHNPHVFMHIRARQ